MYLFFVDGSLAAILMIVAYLSPVAIIGWLVYSFFRNKSENTSITNWKDSDDK